MLVVMSLHNKSNLSRLADRGYQINILTPLFAQAIDNAKLHLSRSESHRLQLKAIKLEESRNKFFYHVPYHRNNPPSSEIQHYWRTHVSSPPNKRPLHFLHANGARLPPHRMIVCYSRAPNLGNKLSYRKICQRKGPKVSSYLWLDTSRSLLFFKPRKLLASPQFTCGLKNKSSKTFSLNFSSWLFCIFSSSLPPFSWAEEVPKCTCYKW